MPKSLLVEQNAINTAIKLMHLGARVPVILALTSLGHDKAHRLFFEVTGKTPKRGQLPHQPKWYMSSVNNIHSSFFLSVFNNLRRSRHQTFNDALISAYRIYVTHFKARPALMSFDRAWWLIQLVQIAELKTIPCTQCKGHFIVYTGELYKNYLCPICKLARKKQDKDKR
jgi:flagellar transcriptional activator FlhC